MPNIKMRKWIINLIIILSILQLVYGANYGQGNYNCGLYGIGCGEEIKEAIGGEGGEGGEGGRASEVAIVTGRLCNESGYIWYNEMCYECEGFIFERNNQTLCGQCPETFVFEDGKCKATISQKIQIPSIIILFVLIIFLLIIITKKSKKQQKKQLEKLQKKFKKEELEKMKIVK